MKTGGLKTDALISSRLKFQSPANNLSMENEVFEKNKSAEILFRKYSQSQTTFFTDNVFGV